MWPKDDRQWSKLSHRVRWLVLGLLNVGCGPHPDECKPFTMRCNGKVVQYCEPSPCAEMGGGCYAHWDTRANCEDSGQVCAEGSPSEAFCALSLVPDPKCRDVGAYCEGSTSVACERGLAVSAEDCTTAAQGALGDAGATDLPAPTCAISSSDDQKPAGCVQEIESCDPGATSTCGAPTECGPLVRALPNHWVRFGSGGSIRDGLYVLTRALVQMPERAAQNDPSRIVTLRGTRRFQNGTLAATDQSVAGLSHASGAYEVDGRSLIWTVSCPEAARHAISYTATDSEVILYEQLGAELTFERR